MLVLRFDYVVAIIVKNLNKTLPIKAKSSPDFFYISLYMHFTKKKDIEKKHQLHNTIMTHQIAKALIFPLCKCREKKGEMYRP